jgi:hypothetical protein
MLRIHFSNTILYSFPGVDGEEFVTLVAVIIGYEVLTEILGFQGTLIDVGSVSRREVDHLRVRRYLDFEDLTELRCERTK